MGFMCLSILLVVLIGLLLSHSSCAHDDIYINAGGDKHFDTSGRLWSKDDGYFNTGYAFNVTTPISGTFEDVLYQSHRYDYSRSPNMIYTIPVSENGSYKVILHFCEVWFSAKDKRLFDVVIQEVLVFDNLDVFEQAGGKSIALLKAASTTVTDKTITIEFSHVTGKDNPMISAIEVHSEDGPPQGPIEFEPIRFNAGGTEDYMDVAGNLWRKDDYYNGGFIKTWDGTNTIGDTNDPEIYLSERWSDSGFIYEIPVPDGLFKVTLHFAELQVTGPGLRLFNVFIEESTAFSGFDIYEQANGMFIALRREYPVRVSDGALTIEFISGELNAKVSGIEVEALGEVTTAHQAHAVPGGPYIATAAANVDYAFVELDGRFSHTHGPGVIQVWRWKEGDVELGLGEMVTLPSSAGEHIVTLEVTDSDGDTQSDVTIVTVRPSSFPVITMVTPDRGDINGGDEIAIIGSGFSFTADETIVMIGSKSVTGVGLTIVNETMIIVTQTPEGVIAGDVGLSVETPVGSSNSVSFTYIDGEKLDFAVGDVFTVGGGPTTLAFGPDGKLYVGKQNGELLRLTLNETYHVVDMLLSKAIPLNEPKPRTILGITFDPIDTSEYPTVYLAHSWLFHKQEMDNMYHGKISKLSGPYLDVVEDVITGLPVSDHDHAVNGMEFGDHGELYFQVGGNTNAGIPGKLSSRNQLDEGYFSAATLVANNIASRSFRGVITYNSNHDPNLADIDVEIFAHGQRNAFDLIPH